MAKRRSDRRRKRPSSPSRDGESSSITIPLIILIGIIVSVLISSSNEADSLFQPRRKGRRQLRADDLRHDADRQRRMLTLDVGLEENVWRRQLRARRDRERELRTDGDNGSQDGGSAWSRMAAAMEGEDAALLPMGDNGDWPVRKMAKIIPRYADKHHFDECVGKSIPECQILVDNYVTEHTEDFKNQTTLLLDIRKMRELTDDSYYKVVLRTNLPGTKVYGIFDDAVVYYPWPWRVRGQDVNIGPWSCEESGSILSPEECCTLIQEDVMEMDDNGNYLACFVEEPVGGPHNPERDDRAIVVTDGKGTIVRAPVAH